MPNYILNDQMRTKARDRTVSDLAPSRLKNHPQYIMINNEQPAYKRVGSDTTFDSRKRNVVKTFKTIKPLKNNNFQQLINSKTFISTQPQKQVQQPLSFVQEERQQSPPRSHYQFKRYASMDQVYNETPVITRTITYVKPPPPPPSSSSTVSLISDLPARIHYKPEPAVNGLAQVINLPPGNFKKGTVYVIEGETLPSTNIVMYN